MASILLVDDEPDVRFMLRRVFERAGHEVTEAIDGAAALEAVAASPPDLLVTDMMMPVMGGAELIMRLRSAHTTAMIVVMAVTGDPHVALQADRVVSKPFNCAALLAVAEELLNRRKANRDG